ncbi:methyltransferase domain-containing protein [Gimibacter soli]|uniref:Methyltransferase domain-containing protein n=1 Tax=Gimibacter soli TaxID=3024400 RepID=A0AAE9XRV6_9PROT|nr:methyltransferase domain-containing protein [Gimibacter soli]WCL54949.1 methyltransferase domain-containing protein [Gimibacter soli]
MVRPDVLSLSRFYRTPLGLSAAQVLGDTIARLSDVPEGGTVVGLGFAPPVLARFEDHARTVALMPARQGVCHWPSHAKSRTVLVDTQSWPIADSSADMVILIHALEHAQLPTQLLREAWRVLVPNGQVVVVVPNRRRMWSALDRTPFGYGRPYSKGQLYTLMEDHMLPPDGWTTALMVPPLALPGIGRLLRLGEKPFRLMGKNLGGALIVHARKHVYGALPKGKAVRAGVEAVSGI